MMYQFLTVHIFEEGKKVNGYNDQRLFKTADRYLFHSIVLENTYIAILDGSDHFFNQVAVIYLPTEMENNFVS